MAEILIFGMGYTASHLAERLRTAGWTVFGTRQRADTDALAFTDEDAVRAALAGVRHVMSSVPPDDDGRDPVLDRYGTALGGRWLGYLSSTGVYGDTGGAWVDESAPVGRGRRSARAVADQAWLRRDARVFRLPGIYGPGRSPLERIAEGRAHRVDLSGQVFSRIHVDDIVAAVIAGLDAPPGAYNIADDRPCSQNAVIEEASRLLRLPPLPLLSLDEAGLSPAARAFYAENRRVANGKAKRILGWRPLYPDYRAGLAACLAHSAMIRPPTASRQPTAASADQR